MYKYLVCILVFVCGGYATSKVDWQNIFSLSYPGTNWCGIDPSVNNNTPLGSYKTTDNCCRTRHRCGPKILSPGFDTNLNLTNVDLVWNIYPCSCEKDLYECLSADTTKRNSKSAKASKKVIEALFQLVLRKCLTYGYQYEDCEKKGKLKLTNTTVCVQYKKSTTGSRNYQFIDVLPF